MSGDDPSELASIAEMDEELSSPHLAEAKQAEKSNNRRAKAREELRKRFMGGLMATREGREWVWDLLSRGHVYSTSYVPGDTTAMAFKEGERNIALYVLSQIPPDAFKVMLEESSEYGS